MQPGSWSHGELACRARFIVGSVQALNAQPGDGDAFLMKLRTEEYPTASAALCALPGVGPKVITYGALAVDVVPVGPCR